jgi:hypothetical protein
MTAFFADLAEQVPDVPVATLAAAFCASYQPVPPARVAPVPLVLVRPIRLAHRPREALCAL